MLTKNYTLYALAHAFGMCPKRVQLDYTESAGRGIKLQNTSDSGFTLKNCTFLSIPDLPVSYLRMEILSNQPTDYIGLNWDYTGQTLDISQVIHVRFTLFILENIQGITDFSFYVTIASS